MILMLRDEKQINKLLTDFWQVNNKTSFGVNSFLDFRINYLSGEENVLSFIIVLFQKFVDDKN